LPEIEEQMMPWDCQQRWFWVAATCLVSGLSMFSEYELPVAGGESFGTGADSLRQVIRRREFIPDSGEPQSESRSSTEVSSNDPVLPPVLERRAGRRPNEIVDVHGTGSASGGTRVGVPSLDATVPEQEHAGTAIQADRDQHVRRLLSIAPGGGRNYEPAFARTGFTVRSKPTVPNSVWLTGGIEPDPTGD
jgi:hypothetical protein